MLQLIWGILNIVAFLGFIVFCIRKTSEIRQKMGLFVAILFAFFALSFIRKSDNEQKDKKFEFESRATEKQSLNRDTYFSRIILDDDPCTKIELNAICDGENVRSALIQRSGLISGTEWTTNYIYINKIVEQSTFQYQIGGTRKWKILGIELYSEFKQFKGTNQFKPNL